MIRTADDANAQVVAMARKRLAAECPFWHYFGEVELPAAEGLLIMIPAGMWILTSTTRSGGCRREAAPF